MPPLLSSRVLVETVNGIDVHLIPETQTYIAETDDRLIRLKSLTEIRRRLRTETPTDEPLLLVESAPRLGWVRPDGAPLTAVQTVDGAAIQQRVSGRAVVTEIVLAGDQRGRSRRVTVPPSVGVYVSDPQLVETLADIERRGRDLLATLMLEWQQALTRYGSPAF